MNIRHSARIRRSKLASLSYERIAILTAVTLGPIDKASIADTVIADSVSAVEIKKSNELFRKISAESSNKGSTFKKLALTCTECQQCYTECISRIWDCLVTATLDRHAPYVGG